MHLVCATLQSFDLHLVDKLDWYSSRSPTELDLRAVRTQFPKAWNMYEEDCKRIDSGSIFICNLCYQGDLMKDARSCIMCGDSFGQAQMIKCSEGRCVKSVHKVCWKARNTSRPFPIDYKCPSCTLKEFMDTRYPEDEDLISGQFLFNASGRDGHPDIVKLQDVDRSRIQAYIQSSLSNSLLPEHCKSRSNEWAQRWLGAEINESRVMYVGNLSNDWAGNTVPPPRGMFFESSPWETPQGKRARTDPAIYSSGKLCLSRWTKAASPERVKKWADICRRYSRVLKPKIMSNCQWTNHPCLAKIAELEGTAYSPPGRQSMIIHINSGDDDDDDDDEVIIDTRLSRTLSNVLRRMDDLINFSHLIVYLFAAIAREYDLIALADQDFPLDMRELFDEYYDVRSPFQGAYHLERTSGKGRIDKPVVAGRVQMKGKSAKGNDHQLYKPLTYLCLLYDQVEAFYGRSLFRLFYRRTEAVVDWLNCKGPWQNDNSVQYLRSFKEFVSAFSPLLAPNSPLIQTNWWEELFTHLNHSYQTMHETNLVINRTNRKYTDDQIFDPLMDPRFSLSCANSRKQLGQAELLCRIQKVFGRFGFLPPIRYESAPHLGLYLRSRSEIAGNTILGEYSGVIESRRWNTNPFLAVSDSIYDIVRSGNSDESLCVVPEPYTNISRYINGINNHIAEEARKVNVFTHVRCLSNSDSGQHIITMSKKLIKEDQQLALDYNTGVDPERLSDCGYPTKHFLPID